VQQRCQHQHASLTEEESSKVLFGIQMIHILLQGKTHPGIFVEQRFLVM